MPAWQVHPVIGVLNDRLRSLPTALGGSEKLVERSEETRRHLRSNAEESAVILWPYCSPLEADHGKLNLAMSCDELIRPAIVSTCVAEAH